MRQLLQDSVTICHSAHPVQYKHGLWVISGEVIPKKRRLDIQSVLRLSPSAAELCSHATAVVRSCFPDLPDNGRHDWKVNSHGLASLQSHNSECCSFVRSLAWRQPLGGHWSWTTLSSTTTHSRPICMMINCQYWRFPRFSRQCAILTASKHQSHSCWNLITKQLGPPMS